MCYSAYVYTTTIMYQNLNPSKEREREKYDIKERV